MKPETAIRNLKRDLKAANANTAREKSNTRSAHLEHTRQLGILTLELEATKRDNQRLEEIVVLLRQLTEIHP